MTKWIITKHLHQKLSFPNQTQVCKDLGFFFHKQYLKLDFEQSLVYLRHVKAYMTDFFIWLIKSPECTDKNSKRKKNLIAIFFPCVLMSQKCQISLLAGYKTARRETGNECDVISGLTVSGKTDFFDIFLFSYTQCTFVPFFWRIY